MILLCGIRSETPMQLLATRLEEMQEPFLLFHQRDFAACDLQFSIAAGAVKGRLAIHGQVWQLHEFHAIYPRLMDYRALPELANQEEGSALSQQCRILHEALSQWVDISGAKVVNPTEAMASNGSKPYQAQLIRKAGFHIPETLITNVPHLVEEFRRAHGKVIYKSISGTRSIVQTLEDADLARLENIRWCPTQFQQFVSGTNLRVHVVGDEVYATAILSDVTDYRYARQQTGEAAELAAAKLNEEWEERCVLLSRMLGLPFCGIDLKITPDGEVFCFEVNPSPAFSYYELNTGQPISAALARLLAAA
jgi:glutathione synthase/RimK-type ligase-like ATP-grasp enzyme